MSRTGQSPNSEAQIFGRALAEDVPSIPDHRLVRLIASGAYGEVWLGLNAVGTPRAVKIVRREQHTSVESFEREFKGLQKFEPVSRSHEGLVDILTLGHLLYGTGFYYVMELADSISGPLIFSANVPLEAANGIGATLVSQQPELGAYSPRILRTELKTRGPLPVGEAIALGLKLTTALAHLHREGLVHRDVKPSNILFIRGEPKLADAGLVAPVDDARSMVGTAGYIAPEGPGTPQGDLYALGKVLYEAAYGKDRQEFPALPVDVASRPDHKQLLELNEILALACAHDPKQRYSSAAAMQEELELLNAGKSVRRMHRFQSWRNVSKWVTIAAFLVGFLAVGIVSTLRRFNFNAPVSSDPQAVVLYEQAKGLLNQHRKDVVFRAYESLAEAVKRDPKFLDAYYMMVECYFAEMGDQLPPYTNGLANFKWVAEEMRKLDPNSAQYHTAVALIKGTEWKWDEMIDHLKLALRANPHFLRAHGLYGGVLLRARADPQASLREFQEAERAGGFDYIIQMHLGTPYYVMGDYAKAIAQFRKALEFEPRANAWEFLGLAYEANGQYLEALDAYERDEKETSDAGPATVEANYSEYRAILKEKGKEAMWQHTLRNYERWCPDPYEMASLHARLGNSDKALDFLEKAFHEQHHAMSELLLHHYWRPLYGNPRFQAIVKQMEFKPVRDLQLTVRSHN
jgi:serine/threonine protein kinase